MDRDLFLCFLSSVLGLNPGPCTWEVSALSVAHQQPLELALKKKIMQSTKKPFQISQMRILKIHPENNKFSPVASSKLDVRSVFHRCSKP